MRVTILCPFNPRPFPTFEITQGYLSRTTRSLPTEIASVKGEKVADPRDAARALALERTRLEERTPQGAWRVALAVNGKAHTSEDWAKWLEQLRDRGVSHLAMYVGSAYGLDPELTASCNERVSLSRLTLPHELALLVLAEQLYRATTLWSGAPYHKP
jgi:23S rRNA (pseudouridine1915-N3)-methyltransferase